MRSAPEPERSGSPRTCVGLRLRAGLRGDNADYSRLARMLNRGQKGWNEDEPAVVEAACQMAVQQFFASHGHVPVDAFVADMRQRIAKESMPSRQEDMEVVIRAALSDNASVPLTLSVASCSVSEAPSLPISPTFLNLTPRR
jgi:hypothetical protein